MTIIAKSLFYKLCKKETNKKIKYVYLILPIWRPIVVQANPLEAIAALNKAVNGQWTYKSKADALEALTMIKLLGY